MAASVLPFYEGVEETLEMLDAIGVEFRVASRASKRYLDAFLNRLSVKSVETQPYRQSFEHSGLSHAASLRYTQLCSFRKATGLTLRIYVGDEKSDGIAANAAGWHFLHACWGSSQLREESNCDVIDDGVEVIHCREPDDVLRATALLQAGFLTINCTERGSVDPGTTDDRVQVAQIPFGSRGRAGFLDVYHPANRGGHDVARSSVLAFKDGSPKIVSALCKIAGRATKALFANQEVSIVVPVLGSKSLKADGQSPTGKLATAIAGTLGARVDLTAFFQESEREKLHHGQRGYAARSDLLIASLRHRPRPGARVLLVDDVITTGASLEVYADLLERTGATVVGAFAIARTDADSPHLNGELFANLARL